MSSKKRFVIALSALIAIEIVYFSSIVLFTYISNISLNILMVQVLGFLIAVLYTIIFDSWLRYYRRNINRRITRLEIEQLKMRKKLKRIEDRIIDDKGL